MTTPLTAPLSDAELGQLGDFLNTLPAPNAMNLERLDGFFCALIVGPDLVMPSEYWPHIVGGDSEDDDPVFDTMEQAQAIMGMVTRHWNTIARKLKSDDIYIPIVLEDDNGLALGNDWAKGFMHGVSLRQDSWQMFLEDEDQAGAIIPMMALAHENDPDPKLRFESPLPEKRKQMLHMMAAGVIAMYRYFAPMRAQPMPSTFVRAQPKIGRNEPCPCGSGKKYKQCCLTRVH